MEGRNGQFLLAVVCPKLGGDYALVVILNRLEKSTIEICQAKPTNRIASGETDNRKVEDVSLWFRVLELREVLPLCGIA